LVFAAQEWQRQNESAQDEEEHDGLVPGDQRVEHKSGGVGSELNPGIKHVHEVMKQNDKRSQTPHRVQLMKSFPWGGRQKILSETCEAEINQQISISATRLLPECYEPITA
jgi:hypothetical protein